MKRAIQSRPFAGQRTHAFLDRDQRIEARAARNANMAEIVRAAPASAKGIIERVVGPAPAQPKPEPRRNATLLEMARGRGCKFAIPGVCSFNRQTTVACHSNESAHGKAKARKADDCYVVYGCMNCHSWYDTRPAARDVKRLAFQLAHLDQVLEWHRIAQDSQEPARFRKAAQWALRELGATP